MAKASVDEDLPLLSYRSWFHFSPALYSRYASADCDAIAWAFTPGHCTAWFFGDPKTLSNDFNWPHAVAQAGQDTGWTALGHVLHLLEDLAVPAHTRNDPHLKEPLEDIVAKLNLLPVVPDGQLIPVTDPKKDLFEQLRDYTERRYFSDDTCFDPDFLGPTADPKHEDNNYFRDSDGRKIAHKGMGYRWSGNPRDCEINSIIAREQFAEIGPMAVRYVASLIKYYSSQTNTYPCKNLSTLYAGSDDSGALYAYDGTSWKTSNIPNLTGLYELQMAVYNGKLYVAGYNAAYEGQVYVLNGNSWTLSGNFGTYNFPMALIVHDSKLYMAITNYVDLLGSVYFYDGVSWTASLAPARDIVPFCFGVNNGILYAGGFNAYPGRGDGVVFSLSAGSWSQSWIGGDMPRAMASYGGNLYVGTGNIGYVNKYDGTSWTGSYSANGAISSLSVYDGALYAGSYYYDSEAETHFGKVYKFDGSSWTTSLSLSWQGSNIAGLSVYGTKLYAGGYQPGIIYVYDGSTWEIDFDPGEQYLEIIGTIDLTSNPLDGN